MKVDVRIVAGVLLPATADFKVDGGFGAAIDQVMAVRDTPRERRTILRAQNLFAGVGDQRYLT